MCGGPPSRGLPGPGEAVCCGACGPYPGRRRQHARYVHVRDGPLTIEARTWLLPIREWIVRWAGRCCHTRRPLPLHVARQARLTGLVLRGRSETRPSLAASRHDALEQIGRSVANRRRRRLHRTVRPLRWTASLLKLVTEPLELFLVPGCCLARPRSLGENGC